MNQERQQDTVESQTSGEESHLELAEVAEETIESLRARLAEEKEHAEHYLTNWQRAQADYKNLRRRTEQERNDLSRFSNAVLITNLLPIFDDLERALDSVATDPAGPTWVEGIRLIYHKLRTTLETQGLMEIPAEGEGFDPNLHEAVMQLDGEDGKVVQVLQKGYRFHDRVIRPAMVAVGRDKKQASE